MNAHQRMSLTYARMAAQADNTEPPDVRYHASRHDTVFGIGFRAAMAQRGRPREPAWLTEYGWMWWAGYRAGLTTRYPNVWRRLTDLRGWSCPKVHGSENVARYTLPGWSVDAAVVRELAPGRHECGMDGTYVTADDAHTAVLRAAMQTEGADLSSIVHPCPQAHSELRLARDEHGGLLWVDGCLLLVDDADVAWAALETRTDDVEWIRPIQRQHGELVGEGFLWYLGWERRGVLGLWNDDCPDSEQDEVHALRPRAIDATQPQPYGLLSYTPAHPWGTRAGQERYRKEYRHTTRNAAVTDTKLRWLWLPKARGYVG